MLYIIRRINGIMKEVYIFYKIGIEKDTISKMNSYINLILILGKKMIYERI